ncbi:MAG: crossover junction endodeoxyribonuclease RuvC, partial [Candidatus Niyogibacteria bacterium]|nr:crossover junction endodeoxyribonuclease RuvC [Candidatus Niyogibacteria bacterium]
MNTLKKPKKVLGIDPGYARCGWAVVEHINGKDVLAEAGCFETDSTKSYQERINAVGAHIKNVLDTHKPDALALEKLFFATNQKTAMRIAEVRGMIMHIAGTRPIQEFTPPQIKLAVCGYGKADKKQVQKMTMLLLGLKEIPTPDDKADAIAVALAGVHTLHI